MDNYCTEKNYLIAIKRTKYRKRVEVIANAVRGKIRPLFSHFKNLIFLLITFVINLNRFNLKLLKARGLHQINLINLNNKKNI